MLEEIVNAVANPNHTVAITWSDGARGVVNFTPFITKGSLFSALADPDYFVREMRILRGGIGIAWPNEVDFSADGLWQDAFPQEETGEFDETISITSIPAETQSPRHPCHF